MITLPVSWARLALTWLLMAVGMTGNGIFRELMLKRVLSSTGAGIASASLGILLIAVITRIGFRPIERPASYASLTAMSVVLVVATIAFETGIGIGVDHRSLRELAGHYALTRGELWPIVLAFLATTPFWWGRWAKQ